MAIEDIRRVTSHFLLGIDTGSDDYRPRYDLAKVAARDIKAGEKAGCQTIFIDYGYTERQPEAPDYRVPSLSEAADVILGKHP